MIRPIKTITQKRKVSKSKKSWNHDVGVSNIEVKISNVMTGLRSLNNSSFGKIKKAYIGPICSLKYDQPIKINKERYSTVDKFEQVVKRQRSKNIPTNTQRFVQNYKNNLSQGLFRKKLAMLKEDMTKGYEKDVMDIKRNKKEHGKLH